MSVVTLRGSGVSVDDVASVARDFAAVETTPTVLARLREARDVLDRVAAGGQRIYGLNTGLGANLATTVDHDASAFQRQLLQGRAGAVGPAMPVSHVRATMLARAAMLSVGGSGLSPEVYQALIAVLNARIHPLMPALGSIGASDLVLLAAMGRMLIGDGVCEVGGRHQSAADALAAAGLAPVALAPKDGLSLINASAVSAGVGALAVVDASAVLRMQNQAAALTMEGSSANPSVLDPRIQEARPGAGQVPAAAVLWELLARDEATTPVALQDPLSIRCLAPIHGALIDAIDRARQAVEIELNAAADNPLVIAGDELVLSTGNFHTAALSLAFEGLGLAIAQAASACAARFIQLTGAGRAGLPKYLSPVGGASAGFVPLQKTVVAILAAIRHRANPVMLDFLPVSEGVEDHAAQTPLVVSKCAEMIELWRRLVAIELLAAAQAVDLRLGLVLAPATRRIHERVRALVPHLDDDRPLGADAEALYAALSGRSGLA